MLEVACLLAVDTGNLIVESEALVKLLNSRGVAEPKAMESQEVLEAQGYVDILRTFGPPRIYDMKVRPIGFDAYATSRIAEYPRKCGMAAEHLVGVECVSNQSISEVLPIRIVDHILHVFESNSWIKCQESGGGGIDVYWVSAELRRKVQE